MSDFQISEEEIAHLLAEPVIEYEHCQIDCLLTNPPIIADRFKFAGGMSLS